MTVKRKKKRSRRTEAEQRHRLLERGEHLGGPPRPRVELPSLDRPRPAPSLTGPAQIATEAYRDGWDAIWGSR